MKKILVVDTLVLLVFLFTATITGAASITEINLGTKPIVYTWDNIKQAKPTCTFTTIQGITAVVKVSGLSTASTSGQLKYKVIDVDTSKVLKENTATRTLQLSTDTVFRLILGTMAPGTYRLEITPMENWVATGNPASDNFTVEKAPGTQKFVKVTFGAGFYPPESNPYGSSFVKTKGFTSKDNLHAAIVFENIRGGKTAKVIMKIANSPKNEYVASYTFDYVFKDQFIFNIFIGKLPANTYAPEIYVSWDGGCPELLKKAELVVN